MKSVKLAAALAMGIGVATTADAAVTFQMTQQGKDILVTATGSADTSKLIEIHESGSGRFLLGNMPFDMAVGANEFSNITIYVCFSPDGVPISSSYKYYDSAEASGKPVGFDMSGGIFYLASDYVSNSAIASQSLFKNLSFQSLGFAEGTYNFKIGREDGTLIIGEPAASPAPEPATWAMMLIGFAMVGGVVRSRRSRVASMA